MRRLSLVSVAALAALTATPGGAGAATQLGETFVPLTGCGMSTRLQPVSPGAQYSAPFTGVITSWSYQADGLPPQLKFKVGRSAGGTDFTIVGESPLLVPVANVLNTTPVRIPVQVGDVIGIYLGTFGNCAVSSATGYTGIFRPGDQAPGTTGPYTTEMSVKNDVSATLEPDADQDAFGDESQDKCLGTPGTANGCPSTVSIDKLKQKGDTKVKVTATVPGAGTLTVGSPSAPALASAAKKSLKTTTRTLTATTKQQLKLPLKLTRFAIGQLADAGKLKVKVKAVYTPVGGPSGSDTKKAKLKN